MTRVTRVIRNVCTGALVALSACAPFSSATSADRVASWVGTWATAPQLTEPANLPPAPGLTGNTLRQVVLTSIGGETLRLRLSNEFGNGPLSVRAAQLALSTGGSAIDPRSARALTFSGSAAVTLAAGDVVVSDPLAMSLSPLTTLAITLHFGNVPSNVTGHPGSRTTSYLQVGDAATATEMADAVKTVHWYVINGIDVVARNANAVSILGNSITDGRGSGTDRQNRWPDELSRRLRADARTASVAVLNMGIGGNCVLRACLGPAAMTRFERDVLQQSGVRWLIVLEGVNDIGQATAATAPQVARDLIAAYEQMIERAHARNIRVYGATILPFGGSFYDSPEREAARQTVNNWIRSSGRFDAVIDTDAALRDPSQPSRLLPGADTGDHLHPNELGHTMIAAAVDLALFLR